MKTMILALLLAATSAFATEEKISWQCYATTPANSRALANLKLPKSLYNKTSGVLTVRENQCGLTTIMIYKDACRFRGLDLAVTLNDTALGTESILFTKTNKKIKLHCVEGGLIGPTGVVGGGN